jgi:hypothetical protein
MDTIQINRIELAEGFGDEAVGYVTFIYQKVLFRSHDNPLEVHSKIDSAKQFQHFC